MIEISLGAATSEPTLVEQFLQVLGALSPFAVLLGVWLGKRWEQSGATERWRRDRRLEVYTRMISTVAEMLDMAARASSYELHAGREACTHEMTLAAGSLGRLVSEIELLGTDEVAEAAVRARDAYVELMGRTIEACEATAEGETVPLPDATLAIASEVEFVRAGRRAIG